MKQWLLLIMLSLMLVVTACELESDQVSYFDLTFLDVNGGIISTDRLRDGSLIVFPEIPSQEGYRFTGFDTDQTVISSDLIIRPVFEKNTYQIRFVTMTDENLMPLEVIYDELIPTLPEPNKTDFEFAGWYVDALYETPLSDEHMPADDLLLFARWEKRVYYVTYETFCEVSIDPKQVYGGDKLQHVDLEREGYRLEGWYLDEQYQERLVSQKVSGDDVTLYARWIPNLYVVRYMSDIQETMSAQGVRYLDDVPMDFVPERVGYSFDGWYLDLELEMSYTGGAMPAHDLILYAKWIEEENLFIRRESDRLLLGDDEFRFASFNVPNLHILEDPNWHMADPFEQEDAIRSVRLMGGNVIRTYTFSIVGGIRPMESGNTLAHIKGIGQYDEALFQSFDKILELANKHGVYVIIPFIDEWQWFGGVAEFAALYGKTKSAFFTNTEIKQGFKDFVSYVLNRENTYTGVLYKDDPMILAWELGNELRSATDPWIAEMATYVKSIDQNHLLMSGRDEVTTADLNNANIDLINSHYYTNNGSGTFAQRARADRLLTTGLKPFIVGEYGLVSFDEIAAMLEEVYQNGTSGSLIWSLRFRNVNGGFYYHNDGPTRSYHYPGFVINDDYRERDIIDLLTIYGHLMQGQVVSQVPVPDAPVLFETDTHELTWRGQTGSATFAVERRILGSDGWTEIAQGIMDAYEAGPFYVDLSAIDGVSYEYRVRAFNVSGPSLYSNIISVS